MKIILTKGLPGSGKTTWAKEQVAQSNGKIKRINKDDLRAMIDAGKWSKENEKFILKIRDIIAAETLIGGHDLIIDDTNFEKKHEDNFKEMAEFFGADFEMKTFTDVPLEECLKRNYQRANPVPDKVIKEMYRKYLQPDPVTIEYEENLPDAIICDIDGTVALMGDRNPYDASTCDQDSPNTLVIGILKSYLDGIDQDLLKASVIFVSGREEKYREKTEEWLARWIPIENWTLHMRPTGDFRKDFIVKKEIYESQIKGKYNVYFVLDDRNRVVQMWREQGLKCLQVADGDF